MVGLELVVIDVALCAHLFGWLYVNAFFGSPIGGSVRMGGAHDLHLAVNGTPVTVTRHRQPHLCVDVFEPKVGIPFPEVAATDECPVVAGISVAILVAESAHLLIAGQRRREVMAVEVLGGGHVLQPYHRAALQRLAPLAPALHPALHRPVTVHIFAGVGAGHRLLATARPVLHVVRVESDVIIGVQ